VADNDGRGVLRIHASNSDSFAFSPRDAPEFCVKVPPSEIRGRRECRAPDAPAASRGEKNTRVSHHGHAGSPGIPRTMVLTAYFALSPVTGYRMHTSLLQRLASTDSMVGVGHVEGGAMSMAVGLGRFGDRRLEKGGCHYMRPWFDGLVRVSDALPGTGRRRFGSRVFCAMKG
jgi:hypothetical protein